jgi:hypothetical protein
MHDEPYIVVTGWNRKITVFQDDNDVAKCYPHAVYPYKRDTPWHLDDVLTMSFKQPHFLVTASYDGGIVLSNLHSGHIINRLVFPGADDKTNSSRSIDKGTIFIE